ncbi:hypothetical protein EUX98_g6127 [Antrodiella citrinella]|uniref:Pre-rRNA-processing protein n=1 Tax=Antrodiella citrinella TaxID=2447956 RepID=A0A4S4MPT0_9APHY|nr:hypothetical protein EUX98_g6127 [Antrodiella citrinella]
MPKATKKQKDKAKDFSKAKLKLGKGKQVANNAIDTSFKARCDNKQAIALPGQSINHDKDANTPSTRRKLTLDDLLLHLKHYNPSTRKDAIAGLRELFSEHGSLALTNLTTVLNRCVRIIGDEDASVRKALIAFFGWFIPLVPKHDLQPHAPTLLLFTTSALTHIFPEIRIDAIRFLDIFLECMPEIVVEGWANGTSNHGRRILEGYLGLLNAGTAFGGEGDPMKATSTASVVLSPKSKLVVLSSLSTFLRAAFKIRDVQPSTSSAAASPTWFLASDFTSESAFNAFSTLLTPRNSEESRSFQCTEDGNPAREGDFFGSFPYTKSSIADSWTLDQVFDLDLSQSAASSSAQGSQAENAYASHLAATLQSTLQSTFLDCAPAAFSPAGNPPENELQTALVVVEIARSLYGSLLQGHLKSNGSTSKSAESLFSILGYMSPYFPFSVNGLGAKRDIKVEVTFDTLNLIYCELTSLLVLTLPSGNPTSHRGTARRSAKRAASSLSSSGGGTPLQVERVEAYVTQLLRGEAPHGANTQTKLPHPISHATYSALLPTIWALISTPDKGLAPNELLVALIDQALKASSGSVVKKDTIGFLGLLMLVSSS